MLFSTDSGEYKNMLNKLNKEDGIVTDLKVFSRVLNGYVSKLENGKFKVYIPLTDDKFKGKELVAVYVKEDGTIEEHPAVIENGYAVFETDHFSTYAIVPTGIDNPPTGDSIMRNIISLLISITMISCSIVLYKKLD